MKCIEVNEVKERENEREREEVLVKKRDITNV